jgi:alpha/beta superfamily hydrolase/outer membrane lipoprotein-sorting protein
MTPAQIEEAKRLVQERKPTAGPAPDKHPTAPSPVEEGKAAYDRGDFAVAAQWWRKPAEQGYAPAQHNLGVLYLRGQGVPQDDAIAAQWFRQAAEQGYAPAQTNLGGLYDQGRGMAQDYSAAMHWYHKAAEQGYAGAQNNMGDMYEQGRGVAQDYAAAARWYRLAAEQGLAVAQLSIGGLYEQGRGVAQDAVQALMWVTLAAASLPAGEEYHRTAVERMNQLSAQMTPAQIEEAKRRAREWKPTAGPAPVSKQQSSGLGNLTSLQGTLILMVSEDRGIPAKFWAKGNNMRLEASVGAKKTITIQVGDTLYTFNEGEKSGLKQHLGRGLGSMGLLRQIELIKTRGKKQGSKEFEGVLCDIYEYEAPQELALVYLSVATSLPQRWISTIRSGDTTSSILMLFRNLEANMGIPDEMFKVPPEVKFSEQDKN